MTARHAAIAGIDPRALRRVNTSVTLRTLAVATEPLSMSAVAESAGLSRRTVELILRELVSAGWVDELERVPTTGSAGRPARRFELRADHALLAAARVTTREASAVVADARGRILGRARRELRDYGDPAATLDDVAQLVREAVERAGASPARLRAGAIASGGAIDDDGVVRRLVHTDRWAGVSLPHELAARIDVPWFADNDANLAALAERWHGVARDHDDVIWAILGARTGIGTLIRGTVHRGFQGGAGELIEAGPLPSDAIHDTPVGALTSPDPSERRAALALVARAREGDADALALVEEYAEHVAAVLVILSWTVAPSLFVLGGGAEDAADILLPLVRRALERAGAPGMALRATSVGADAPLIGALRFVLDRMDVALFGPVIRLSPASADRLDKETP
ncbi:transcriptional regulator [Microbacterium barkeri]|uniref:Transcriptional regulator n=1 Tax=Microbacterium barkeri TaxID=33917 RepID=A0A9W6H288_9MICO|nr:ROK family protein [Microbacterium barkeri]MDI6942936.1 ROK family protein [Microbacterium barkeri]MDR6877781.1 putative NBD/HSP70 family sugar kinase [Microbacterium barkeri]GLJ60937.1 transcriptional regulator [Microbacterium barkeri]